MKAKKETLKRRKKKAMKPKGKQIPDQGQVWEFDNFIRERLRSVGIIE